MIASVVPVTSVCNIILLMTDPSLWKRRRREGGGGGGGQTVAEVENKGNHYHEESLKM